MDKWQPIETAVPTDKMDALGYGRLRGDKHPRIAIMTWSDWVGAWAVNALPFEPTHFMPLPPPPEEYAASADDENSETA